MRQAERDRGERPGLTSDQALQDFGKAGVRLELCGQRAEHSGPARINRHGRIRRHGRILGHSPKQE